MNPQNPKSKKKTCENCTHLEYDEKQKVHRCPFLCRTIMDVNERYNCLFHEVKEDATR